MSENRVRNLYFCNGSFLCILVEGACNMNMKHVLRTQYHNSNYMYSLYVFMLKVSLLERQEMHKAGVDFFFNGDKAPESVRNYRTCHTWRMRWWWWCWHIATWDRACRWCWWSLGRRSVTGYIHERNEAGIGEYDRRNLKEAKIKRKGGRGPTVFHGDTGSRQRRSSPAAQSQPYLDETADPYGEANWDTNFCFRRQEVWCMPSASGVPPRQGFFTVR